jgi:hypothetical protein
MIAFRLFAPVDVDGHFENRRSTRRRRILANFSVVRDQEIAPRSAPSGMAKIRSEILKTSRPP